MNTLIGKTIKGRTKCVLVEEDSITISYQAAYHGFKGDKRIPYASITSVQFREPGWIVGHIQLGIKGAIEWHGAVTQDENAVEFDKPAGDFHALREFINAKMQASNSPSNSHSIADELAKLAVLREQGILTDDEFATQKIKILK